MRIREPDLEYTARGPFLVTRQWLDGRSETQPADTLDAALHRALHWHSTGPDQGVVVIDGWGEFVFGRSAHHAPPEDSHDFATRECVQVMMSEVTGGVSTDAGSSGMFSGIDPS